jgi:hypothetical protein
VSLLDAVRAKLIADGVVEGVTGVICTIGYSPDTADRVVSMYNTGGSPEETQASSYAVGSIQVRVRAPLLDYPGGLAKYNQVFASLQNADLSAAGVHMLIAMNTMPMLWYDAIQRPNFSLNLRVKVAF